MHKFVMQHRRIIFAVIIFVNALVFGMQVRALFTRNVADPFLAFVTALQMFTLIFLVVTLHITETHQNG